MEKEKLRPRCEQLNSRPPVGITLGETGAGGGPNGLTRHNTHIDVGLYGTVLYPLICFSIDFSTTRPFLHSSIIPDRLPCHKDFLLCSIYWSTFPSVFLLASGMYLVEHSKSFTRKFILESAQLHGRSNLSSTSVEWISKEHSTQAHATTGTNFY